MSGSHRSAQKGQKIVLPSQTLRLYLHGTQSMSRQIAKLQCRSKKRKHHTHGSGTRTLYAASPRKFPVISAGPVGAKNALFTFVTKQQTKLPSSKQPFPFLPTFQDECPGCGIELSSSAGSPRRPTEGTSSCNCKDRDRRLESSPTPDNTPATESDA